MYVCPARPKTCQWSTTESGTLHQVRGLILALYPSRDSAPVSPSPKRGLHTSRGVHIALYLHVWRFRGASWAPAAAFASRAFCPSPLPFALALRPCPSACASALALRPYPFAPSPRAQNRARGVHVTCASGSWRHARGFTWYTDSDCDEPRRWGGLVRRVCSGGPPERSIIGTALHEIS